MKKQGFEQGIQLLEETLADIYRSGVAKSGDPQRPVDAILPEHMPDFLDFRKNMNAVLLQSHGPAAGDAISTGYMLSQVMAMRESHDLPPADVSDFSPEATAIAYELFEKDQQVNADGTPRSLFDDLGQLSLSAREALTTMVVCNLQTCGEGTLDKASSHLEGSGLFISKMPDPHELKTMPLLLAERQRVESLSSVPARESGLDTGVRARQSDMGGR